MADREVDFSRANSDRFATTIIAAAALEPRTGKTSRHCFYNASLAPSSFGINKQTKIISPIFTVSHNSKKQLHIFDTLLSIVLTDCSVSLYSHKTAIVAASGPFL